MRTHGGAALEWVARYLDEVERYPVLPDVKPGDIMAQLPASPPDDAESLDVILGDFTRTIVPGITHWNAPTFFGYFATTASVPGIIAELLVAALDVKVMLWKVSPAATELEIVVMRWMRDMLGLSNEWFGLTTDTASISSMLALAAARESRVELKIREKGLAGRPELPRLRVYASAEAHSSIDKGALALGIGLENVVRIPSDDAFRMRVDALAAAVAADRAAGYLPLACVATVGTTSTSSVDPVAEIADVCAREGMWLHVDAAYAGVAAIAPSLRGTLDGVDRADSVVVNPHKWMFTPFDCSTLFLRRPDILERAFSLVPEYLVTAEQDRVVNFMDYGVQLGRRFRALKLWMIIRAFGVRGIANAIEEHCRLARLFASWVSASSDWVVAAPVPFALVCFRYAPDGMSDAEADAANERIMEAVNAGGEVFLSHTKLRGRYVMRLSIGNIRTEERHIALAWERLQSVIPSVARNDN
jgi:aromatic-L-amino-acid decarboxylase